jgi:hypothetical protein
MQTNPKSDRSEARRRAALAKVHIAKTRLRLDDQSYRSVIGRVCGGKTSAGDLDEAELGRLLDEFKNAFNFREGVSFTKKLSDFPDTEPQRQLINCLWTDLAALKIIRDGSEKALRKFVERTTKIAQLRWLTAGDANKVIEAMKAMKARGARNAA